MFKCAPFSAQRAVFIDDMNALSDVANVHFNLAALDIMNSKVLINLITRGLHFPIADYDADYYVN